MKLEKNYMRCVTKLAPTDLEWTTQLTIIKSLDWSEEKACKYAPALFCDGIITQIKLIGKDGIEL